MGKYYYLNAQNEQSGPAEASDLKILGVTESTLVWTQGMPQWAPANEVEELKKMFAPVMEEMVPPPIPTPMPSPEVNPAPSPAPANPPSSFSPTDQSAASAMGTAYNKVERTPATTPRPSAPVSSPSSPDGKPDNNMIWAVLSTVMCCVPIGIYAIICANKVDELYNAGNVEEANRQAAEAKKWAIIAAGVGAVGGFLYAIIMIIASLSN